LNSLKGGAVNKTSERQTSARSGTQQSLSTK